MVRMSQPIKKGDGVTPTERYLKNLCEKTFLSLWSYPAVYRDQRGTGKKEGKELCDLLVVFENDILIFSDKNCLFPDSGNLELDWKRWFRRAVSKSAEQAWGAERWIKLYPTKLFLDKSCTQPFPYSLPDSEKMRFHLIVVAHDVARRCALEFGGSGSLMIKSDISGIESHTLPFTIGDLDPEKSFVHIFDDTSLGILMQTRDTISDFVDYLIKKEHLIRQKKLLIYAAGEEELLAHFLKKIDDNGEHNFIFPSDVNGISLLEGHWEDFQKNPQRKAQVLADGISYAWDSLIETFNKHALEGSQFRVTPPGIQSSEKIMRFFARESRVRRRILSKALVGMIRDLPEEKSLTRYVLPSSPGDPYYVFLLFPLIAGKTHEEYREIRGGYLEMYCRITKLRNPAALDIIGIATESGYKNHGRSEDAMYYDARIWTDEDQKLAKEILQTLELPLQQPTPHYSTEKEYPEVERPFILPKNPRNKPCPCNSGKTYKKCHGKNG